MPSAQRERKKAMHDGICGLLLKVGVALLALVPFAHAFLTRTGTFTGATQDVFLVVC